MRRSPARTTPHQTCQPHGRVALPPRPQPHVRTAPGVQGAQSKRPVHSCSKVARASARARTTNEALAQPRGACISFTSCRSRAMPHRLRAGLRRPPQGAERHGLPFPPEPHRGAGGRRRRHQLPPAVVLPQQRLRRLNRLATPPSLRPRPLPAAPWPPTLSRPPLPSPASRRRPGP